MSGGFGCPRGVESEWVDQWDGKAWCDNGGDGAPSEFRRSAGQDKKDKRKRYKGVGAEGGIPLSNFFSRLLLAQPYSAMSSYTSRTTRQNASNTNAESTLVRGIGFANQQRGNGDHYRYYSSRQGGSISHSVVARMPTVRGGRCPYPSLSSITQHAHANMLGHDTFSNLYLSDLLFASAVST